MDLKSLTWKHIAAIGLILAVALTAMVALPLQNPDSGTSESPSGTMATETESESSPVEKQFYKEDRPTVEIQFDYNDGNNELTLTHEGGDMVKASNVLIRVNGEKEKQWPESDTFDGKDVAAGSSTTISNVSSIETIEVVWTGERLESDDQEPKLLYKYTT